MRNISIFLSLLFVLSTCKKDEDTSVLVNASVANSSEGSVDFKSGDYSIGSSVTFSATPKTGYVFSNWTNTSTNQTYTTNPLSITVNENTTLVANFEKAAYNVMFTISGDGSVQKEVVGGGGYTHGSQVKLTATPSENYSFFYWNNDPGDTENPKTITLEGDQNIPTKFDYQVARDLVGNWEFVISDPASKNVTTIKMSIDIFLNVLMTTIVNGEVISQIFTQMITISATAILIGDFAVITDVVVASATSLSMNMVSIPGNTAPPTNESEIPDTGSELNLSGNKSDEEPEKDDDGIIIPPTDAVTASSTTQDLGAIFEDSFDKLAGVQSSTLSSDTLDTGTATSTTGAVSDTSCTLDATLKSSSSDNQTVASGSSIDEIVYDIITDCTRVIHLVSSSGLPSGVSASITGDELKISGTPSGGTSETFNYSIVIDNHLEQTSSAPFVSATVSKVVSGIISVINTGTTTTTNTGTTSSTASGGGGSSGTTSDTSTNTASNCLAFDSAKTRIVNEFCYTSTTSGTGQQNGQGSIELETREGLAFSGGSNQYTFSWTGPNAYTNSSMNITNLLPGVYTVRVIDNINNCENSQSFTILPAEPITLNPTGETSPSPQAGVSNVADFKVEIPCSVDSFTLKVQAQGGIISFPEGINDHIYNWSRNGIMVASGTSGPSGGSQLTVSEPGIYTVEASIDLTGVEIPYQFTVAQMVCAQSVSFEVISANCSSTSTTNTTDTSTSTGGGGNNSGTTSNTSGTNSSTSTNNNCTISSSLTSGSDIQTVVQGNQIQTITYSISSDCNQLNDTNILGQQLVSNIPPGVTALLSGNTVTISGTPTSQASGTFNFSITIDDSVKPTGTVAYAPPTVSTTITGIINVEVPVDELVLTSSQNTINQAICDASPITPITYQLAGSATTALSQGFPLGVSIGPITNNSFSIEGTASVNVVTSTVYNYSITSNGSQSKTVSGSITVHPPSQITRTSGDANIVVNSRTDSQENQLTNTSFSLSFQIGNATGYNLTWDDNSIFNSNADAGTPDATFEPNTGVLTISGNPGATGTTTHPAFKTYNYTITTTGNNNGCDEASISGSIELVDGMVQPETYTINVTASNASNYTLSGSDRNGDVTGSDPSVTLNVGDTIDFVVDASGHPFYLKTVQGTGTSNLISGVTNNGATNGTVSWTPSATGTYYYQCSLHNGMYGTITVN